MRQFDAPYVSNLTVVENLAYSAELRIRDKDDDGNLLTFDDKFKRVRMVLNLADLHRPADVVVDKTGGGGLSGGQKRRLAVAIELAVLAQEEERGEGATSHARRKSGAG